MTRQLTALAVILFAWLTMPFHVSAQILPSWVELAQSKMTATASNHQGSNDPSRAIDGNTSTFWETRQTLPQWLQIDLGQRRWVTAIDVRSGSNYRLLDYALYMSDDLEDWGDPVATDSLPNDPGTHPIVFNFTAGRYVRLVALSNHNGRVYIYNIRFYTHPFELRDQQTGNDIFTNSDTVDVGGLPSFPGYTHYQITDSDEEPTEDWLAYDHENVPSVLEATFPEPTGNAQVTLYAWFMDANEIEDTFAIDSRIIYTAASPVVSVNATFDAETYDGALRTVGVTDIDDGTTGGPITLGDRTYDLGIHSIGIGVGSDAPTDTIDLSVGQHTVTLTVTNLAGTVATDTSLVTISDAAADSTEANVTWVGNAGIYNTEWFRGQNWAGGVPPANPTPGHVIFAQDGLSDTVAKRLPPVSDWEGTTPTNTWRVGQLRAVNNTGQHLLELGGRTIDIVEDLYVQRSGGTAAHLELRGGGDVIVGRDVIANQNSSLIVTDDVTLVGPFRNVTVGLNNSGVMDMRGGSSGGGLFEANILRIGGSGSTGFMYLGPGSVTTLKIHDGLYLNSTYPSSGNQRGGARIGAPDPARGNDWYLPSGVDILVGSETQRARLHIHYITSNWIGSDYSRLAADSGGAFVAWLHELIVSEGAATGGSDIGPTGTLDLGGMDSCFLDATEARIGRNVSDRRVHAWVHLPAGTARVDRLLIGDSRFSTSIAQLHLSNTVFQIDEKLDMKDSTDIRIGIWGASAGLDLHADAEIVVEDSPTITLRFEVPPTDPEAPYWGLRQPGDHAVAFGVMLDTGILVMVNAFDPENDDFKPAVYYDAASGFTYAGLIDADAFVPPVLSARDVDIEVADQTTVRVGPDDLIEGISNPDAIAETGRTVSHPDFAGGDELPYIDFPTGGSLPVTYNAVTVTVHYVDDIIARDTADVTFVPEATATTETLTWEGLARLQYEPRREWHWGQNWSAAAPPANPTPATLTFTDIDQDPAEAKRLAPIPDWDGTTPTNVWTIGSLRAGHSSGTHVLDLDGQTLRTTGQVLAQRLAPTGSGTLIVRNGTLEVGTDLRARVNSTIDLRDMGGSLLSVGNRLEVHGSGSTLRLDGGVVLHGRTVAYEIGYGSGATLDLRGTTVDGGVLDLDILRLGGSGATGTLHLDTNTLHTLIIRQTAHFNGDGQRGGANIGEQVGGQWFLPVGTDVRIGSEEAPGELVIGYAGSWVDGGLSRLAGSSNATFEAWLNTLTVSETIGSDGGNPGQSVLDLRAMDAMTLHATTVKIGVGTTTRRPYGQAYLGTGTATVGDLTLGHVGGNSATIALLDLNDTLMSVTNSLTAFARAELTANIRANRASGFELPALPTLPDGATMTIRFEADPTHGNLHYGLKISGDVAAALQDAIIVDPQDPQPGQWLIVDDAALTGKPATIFTVAGDTYVGIPPPGGTLFLLR